MMDLAAHLGMTVGRLRSEMSLREFLLWRLKWSTDPWGEYREDVRAALICTVLANIHRDVKKHPQPVKLDEFMLFRRVDTPETDEQPRRGPTVSPGTVAWLDAMVARTRRKVKKNGD